MNQRRIVSLFMMTAFVSLNACNSSDGPAGIKGPGAKGIGKFQHVELTHPLNEQMVKRGRQIYEIKCASCHRLDGEKQVGPGLGGVTDRRTPEWIMNFITNTDEMIEKDPVSQQMLEECLVRMPNQSLSDADARAALEFMRKNDGKE